SDAVASFKDFEAIDPRSALVKFYVSFALRSSRKTDDKKHYDEADLYLRKALAAPDVEPAAKSWIKDHLKFDTYLVGFAESRIRQADDTAEIYEGKKDLEDETRDKEVRQSGYQVAMDALRLAEKLNPGSVKTQRLLAKT